MKNRKLWWIGFILLLAAGCTPEEPFEEKNLALNLDYELSIPASEQYPDAGGELTDGILGGVVYTDDNWQGHEGQLRRTVTFDLKERKSISRITAHFLQGAAYSIRVPLNLTISVSNDGEKWGTLATIPTEVSPDSELSKRQTFEWNGAEDGVPGSDRHEMVYAQYVKVSFLVDGWVLLDEIEIWGTDGKRRAAAEVRPDQEPVADMQYMRAGEQTGNILDLILFYNGQYPSNLGDWRKEQFVPYVGYVDENGKPSDFMFDGGLFLGIWSKYHRSFVEGETPGNMKDWLWYLDKTFGEEGDAGKLNEAVKEVAEQLGQPEYRMKVVFMIPYPAPNQDDFGDIDGDGKSENFAQGFSRSIMAANEDRKKAVKWYIDELMKRWDESAYGHLELTGLYWMNESINSLEEQVVQYASELVRERDLIFYWIPYFTARGVRSWERLGFDAVALQPNHFFNNTEPVQIQRSAELSQMVRVGVEIELDDRVFTDASFKQRYIDYLNGGIDFGFDGDVFRAYYQDIRTLQKAAESTESERREVYDWTYQFMNGQYEKK